ncbi:hypothetical protein T4E_9422 [Trichinella pseudospiralis]|uniref:Integrase catalytic domain-containing protein n=1 Tax=Trichinella pseudospiralis TaxID=6337 RepID=A0A0V0XVR3_TRIPS|nr:hypothetical protein T4E_9422 [Trichinella pseudospiralis]
MIVLGSRVVIPKALRRDMRFSSNAPRRQNVRAHQVVDYHYARCDECVGQLPSQARELFKLHESVKRSSEQVHVDVITFTKSRFLVLIEQFSSLLHVVLLPNNRNTARHIIDVTVRLFLTTFGISIKFWSDNSPFFFQSRVKRILAKVKCGSQYISSPYYPQLNWFKEGAIKLMKKMTADSSTSESFDEDKFSRSIFLYKNAQALNPQSNKNELEKGKQVYYYNPHKQYLTLLKIDAHVLNNVRNDLPVKSVLDTPMERRKKKIIARQARTDREGQPCWQCNSDKLTRIRNLLLPEPALGHVNADCFPKEDLACIEIHNIIDT